MALYIDDLHIIYYHMDVYRSIVMKCSYFTSPDYLFVQGWTKDMSMYPSTIHLSRPIFIIILILSWGS